jgi:hypothetical protein
VSNDDQHIRKKQKILDLNVFEDAVTASRSQEQIIEMHINAGYCYIYEVSLVVALALLQQCNSTTLLWRFLRYTTMLDGFGVIGR